jgi:hypothetical protein
MIHSPVLIIGCARSGTTLLYNILSEVSSLWSIGYESKAIIERYHSPEKKGWDSGVLTAEDLTADSREFIPRRFAELSVSGDYWRRVNRLRRSLNGNPAYQAVKNRGRQDARGGALGSAVPGAGLAFFRRIVEWRNKILPPASPFRLLEKTPENCLRLPFLAALFPDARVIFLTRDGRANVHSLVQGWRQPHLFPGYQTPLPVTSPGQSRGRWAFTLIPGWRDLVDSPLEVISAHQWVLSNQAVLDYIRQPDSLPVLTVRYEDLVLDTAATLTGIGAFLDLSPEAIPAIGKPLPEVNVVTAPDLEKWRREPDVIQRVMSLIEPMMQRLSYMP